MLCWFGGLLPPCEAALFAWEVVLLPWGGQGLLDLTLDAHLPYLLFAWEKLLLPGLLDLLPDWDELLLTKGETPTSWEQTLLLVSVTWEVVLFMGSQTATLPAGGMALPARDAWEDLSLLECLTACVWLTG